MDRLAGFRFLKHFLLAYFTEVERDKKSDVEVRIGPVVKPKVNKLQAEIEASIKRKINRRKKETQLMMHQVHLLSWIGYGNFMNEVLNSVKLMQMVVKYIPSEKCYPKGKTGSGFPVVKIVPNF